MKNEKDPYANEANTGHVWDDNLRELTNPPPRWWMIGFHASWLFVVAYTVLYPSWPTISGHTTGLLGWTSIQEYKEDLKTIEDIRAPFENRISTMSAAEVLADDELANYTVRSAKVLFGDFCSGCHGGNGAGNLGFPVLADDNWLYGGSVENIQASITKGRSGAMPGFADKLSEQELSDISQHVVALSKGEEHEAGKPLFMSMACFVCHGADAKGNPAMGAANLTDAIWRFSPGTVESVAHTIAHGVNDAKREMTRDATMPSFEGRLSEDEIKKLSVFVHKLGGGQ